MNEEEWSLKEKRKLFRSLRNWGCDAECGLYKFDEDEKELIIPDWEKEFTPKNMLELSKYDLEYINEKRYYISGTDIEILRKKLIEDIDNYLCE